MGSTPRRSSLHSEEYRPIGTPHTPLLPPDDAPPGKPRITVFEYTATEVFERQVERIEDAFECRDNPRVSWINIDGLTDVESIQKLGVHFHIHPLALEDVTHTEQRSKVETFDDYLFIVTHLFYCDDKHSLFSEQLSIFVARNFVITLQEDPLRDIFDPLRQRIRQGRGYARGLKSDYLGYMLLDSVVDHYFPVLERLGEGIEELEDELMTVPDRASVRKLHDHKRMLTQLRRYAWPQREVVSQLSRGESDIIQPTTKVFFRDCYDHAIQIMDIIESYRELTSSMMDVYLSSVSIRTNEVMKVLTIISTIFIPLTFVVGVYGMNFDYMPELRSKFGYPAVWLIMLAIAGGLLLFFRKKDWL